MAKRGTASKHRQIPLPVAEARPGEDTSGGGTVTGRGEDTGGGRRRHTRGYDDTCGDGSTAKTQAAEAQLRLRRRQQVARARAHDLSTYLLAVGTTYLSPSPPLSPSSPSSHN
ncbi:hypothetical protein PIB30_018804 [Stylosanthes scabra]|uniref:Uncharacterized protein n=1 Tax=Stylosanthes scabra TaxID=79078 RepID=A0ABU6S9F0_9FABA|nr:hypothetical protein [Stylosanthes scabra]